MLIFFLQLFLQVSVNYINGSTRVYDCRNTNSTNFNVNPTVFVLPGIGNCKNVVASLKFIRTLDWGIIQLVLHISVFLSSFLQSLSTVFYSCTIVQNDLLSYRYCTSFLSRGNQHCHENVPLYHMPNMTSAVTDQLL